MSKRVEIISERERENIMGRQIESIIFCVIPLPLSWLFLVIAVLSWGFVLYDEEEGEPIKGPKRLYSTWFHKQQHRKFKRREKEKNDKQLTHHRESSSAFRTIHARLTCHCWIMLRFEFAICSHCRHCLRPSPRPRSIHRRPRLAVR